MSSLWTMESMGFIEPLDDAQAVAPWLAKEMVAGFLALRTAEDAINGRVTTQQIETARQWASKITRLSVRRRLLDILEILAARDTSDIGRGVIARALLAFGSDLHGEGLPHHATVVFRTVEALFDHDVEWRLAALQGIAYSSRMQKKHAEAKMAYETMLSVSAEHRHTRMELEAMLGLAKIAIERGNFPEAAAGIAKVLPRARRLHVRELIGRALVDRGTVNAYRGELALAIFDYNEALDYADPQDLRDHAMYNMAFTFREVDFPVAARDLAAYLWYNAAELEIRWHAGVLRYNLALDGQDWPGARRIEGQLSQAHLSPQPEADYRQALSRDYALRDLWDDARAAAEEMRAIARRHEMFEVLHRAENALSDIQRHVVPAVFAFKPTETTTAAKRKLAAVERTIAKLCAL